MLNRIVTYTLAVAIVGVLFAGITHAIIEFVPYFFCGLLTVSPFYGLFRKVKGRTHGIKYLIQFIPRFYALNKSSIGFWCVLAIIVFSLREAIVLTFIKTIVLSIITMGVVFVVWETMRAVLRVTKNVEILSFIEALKQAL